MNTTTNKTPWAQSFARYQELSRSIRQRGEAIDRSIHNQGWALAESVGIGRCACSLHNASIDDDMTGWCRNNPQRLKVAKRANYLVNHWPGSRLADRIIARAWNRIMAAQHGAASVPIA